MKFSLFSFTQALSQLIADPVEVARDPENVLQALVQGWGNALWVAQPDYLAACLQACLESPGPILECGSGLSTLVAAVAARYIGQPLWVLEHDVGWRELLQKVLDTYQLVAHLPPAPLQDYGAFSWYAPPWPELPTTFARVICDGPPGNTPGGRYGLVPVMQAHLAADCLILLDDLHRLEEQAIAARWATELPAHFHTAGQDRPYGVIQMIKSST